MTRIIKFTKPDAPKPALSPVVSTEPREFDLNLGPITKTMHLSAQRSYAGYDVGTTGVKAHVRAVTFNFSDGSVASYRSNGDRLSLWRLY